MIENQIQNRILNLSPNKQLLFGVSCVIRMQVYLERYLISKGQFSSFAIIRNLIDKTLFRCAMDQFNQIVKNTNIEDIHLIEQIIPDTDEDGSNEAVLAQNAAIALAYCLDFTEENNVDFINYCRLKAIETADIIALGILNLENSDSLVSKELAVQSLVLDIINYMKRDFNSMDIQEFKQIITQFKMEY